MATTRRMLCEPVARRKHLGLAAVRTAMGAQELGLLSMAAATFAGWAAASVVTYGIERRLRWTGRLRLAALGGVEVTPHRVQLGDGREVRVRIRPDQRVELWVRVPVPGLSSGARLRSDPGPGCPAVIAALHLALAREGLLHPEMRLRAQAGALEIGQLTDGLPTVERMRGLLVRVTRAAAAANFEKDGDGLRREAIRGLIDPDPWVRLAAARIAGSLGRTVLSRLVVARGVAPEVRVGAVRALVRRAAASEALPILERAARTGIAELATVAVRALGDLEEGGPALVRLLSRRRMSVEVQLAAVGALSRHPDWERFFLAVLPRVGAAAQRTILDQLAGRGGPGAYAGLDEILSHGGLGVRLDGPLRRAVRETRRRCTELRGALSEAPSAPVGALSGASKPAVALPSAVSKPKTPS